MKKLVFLLGVLLSLGVFCACSSDDDGSNYSEEMIDLTPINDGNNFAAISEFFKTAFGGSYDDDKPFDFKNNLNNEDDPCIVINTEEEFKEAYTGDLSLPAIDFSNYTLTIGKIFLPAGEFIDNMSIKQTNPIKTTLYINCIIDTNPNVGYLGVSYWVYYWKLFPKFYASKINVEISEEKGIVDDSKKQYE